MVFASSSSIACGSRDAFVVLVLASSACTGSTPRGTNCADCTIQIEHVARLGSPDGPGALTGRSMVVSRLSDGRFIIGEHRAEGVKVFGPDGGFLGSIGRRGEGPGEFLMPVFRALDPSGDTLVIVDRETGRITLLSPDGKRVLGTRPFFVPMAPYLLFLGDGRMIANGLHAGDEHIGLPLHLVSRDGDIVRSFGAEVPVYLATEYNQYYRMMDVSHDGGVWSGEVHRYRIEKWDTTGTLSTRLDRNVDWFPLRPRPHIPRSPDADPPSTRIAGLWESEPGLLWVALRVAAPEWRSRFYEVPGPPGAKRYRLRLPEEAIWITRFEILDARASEMLATRDFEHPIMGMLGDGYFATLVFDDDLPFVDVWRLDLSPSPRRSQ